VLRVVAMGIVVSSGKGDVARQGKAREREERVK